MYKLDIKLLGQFHLVCGEEAVPDINQRRLQSLLAYLLFHRNAPQARQHLAFLLWPDSTEAQARTNLRRELHYLRHTIPDADQYLVIDTKTIGWRPEAPFTLDVADFEALLVQANEDKGTSRQAALEQAVALYGGQLLPGSYDEWLLPERERLEQQFIGALEQLLLLLEKQGDHLDAIRFGQRLLRHDPLHEQTYCHLMDLYALSGDRARALRVYHNCVTVLERELGVEPGPETQEAYHRLMHLHASQALPDRPVKALRKSARLVGREDEWAMLRAAWSQALQGEGGLVLISGEAGIGKTHLAEAMLTSMSQEGIVTATGRAYAAEGRLAYAPVLEWLRSDNLYSTLTQLDEVWLTELSRLVPELLSERPNLPTPELLRESWQRRRLFEALARAILSDERPRLLLLDDVQWSDQETLEWLRYLLRFDTSTPLLILGTVRSEEIDPAHPLQALQAALQRSGQLTEIKLEPLNVAQTSALATQTAGQTLGSDEARRLYQETEGSPLFIVEMVRTQLNEGDGRTTDALPPKVQGVIQYRLIQLSSKARDLAALAATFGRSFTFEVLVEASKRDEDAVVQGLDELWQRRIIREQGVSDYDFSHDRIREVAYSEISPARRRQLHRRVAGALEQIYAADLDAVSAQLAAHYERAGLVEQAVDWYERAAEAARRLVAVGESIALGKAGLALFRSLPAITKRMRQEVSMLLSLGQDLIWSRGFSFREREGILLRAEALSLELGDQRQRFAALDSLRTYYAGVGDMQKSHQQAQELLTLACLLEDSDLLRSAYRSNLLANLQMGKFKQAMEFQRYDSSSLLLWLVGYPDQARQRVDESLSKTKELPLPFTMGVVLFFAAWVYWCLGLDQLVLAAAEKMVSLGRKYEMPLKTVVSNSA